MHANRIKFPSYRSTCQKKGVSNPTTSCGIHFTRNVKAAAHTAWVNEIGRGESIVSYKS